MFCSLFITINLSTESVVAPLKVTLQVFFPSSNYYGFLASPAINLREKLRVNFIPISPDSINLAALVAGPKAKGSTLRQYWHRGGGFTAGLWSDTAVAYGD